MKRFLFWTMVVAAVVLALVGWVFADDRFNFEVKVAPDCDGVAVSTTGAAEIVWIDASGIDQKRWQLVDSGGGYYPWGGESRLEGVATVTWEKFHSSDFGETWISFGVVHEESRSWAAERPGDCPPFGKNSLEALGEAYCDGKWAVSAEVSEGGVLTFYPSQSGRFGKLDSVKVTVDADWPDGDHQSVTVEIGRRTDCGGGTGTTVPKPTRVPTRVPAPSGGCKNVRWNVNGVLRDTNGNILAVTGGNFYIVSFELVKNDNGVITRTGARYNYPVFDNGTWTGGGYLPIENLDRLSVAVVDANGRSYQAVAWSIHSTTGQRLADQQQYVGTYCGTMTLEVVIDLSQPLP